MLLPLFLVDSGSSFASKSCCLPLCCPWWGWALLLQVRRSSWSAFFSYPLLTKALNIILLLLQFTMCSGFNFFCKHLIKFEEDVVTMAPLRVLMQEFHKQSCLHKPCNWAKNTRKRSTRRRGAWCVLENRLFLCLLSLRGYLATFLLTGEWGEWL